MATKMKTHRLEIEIDKCRSEENWAKALDLARQISSKSPHLELLSNFVLAESHLERYLLENPACEKNVNKAQDELQEVKTRFNDVMTTESKTLPADMLFESRLLMAKWSFATGDYQSVLEIYEKVGLETFTDYSVSSRRLKIVGEAFAIKGLCLEKSPPTTSSKFKHAEREEQIIRCFEKSGDLSLVQLQQRQLRGTKATSTAVALQSGGQWNLLDSDSTGVGPVVETAIQRSPILYIRNGELSKGVGRFRDMLRVIETRAIQGLRQTLARQLAEVLLRGTCENTYRAIDLTSANSPSSSKNRPTPKQYEGKELFVPKNHNEEILLLLLISESIASREAVLNRSPEHTEARHHTFHNTTAVYDLLSIALVKRAQYEMLSETFERALKFSFDEFHIWYQFALSLICAEKYNRALLVLKECTRLAPNNMVVLMQASQLCLQDIHSVDEGIEFAEKAIQIDSESALSARAFLAWGIGCSLKAEESRLNSNRQEYQRKALNHFLRALALDSNDFLAQFHVALQLAQVRQIPEAMKHVRKALKLRGDHPESLHLLVLLLNAQNQNTEALALMKAAVMEHPENFSLLLTKSRLEEVVEGPEEALQTCRQMLQLWRDLFEPSLENDQRGTGLIDKITNDHRSLVQLSLEVSDKGSAAASRALGSMRADSLAASRVERTLSEVASSLGSCLQPKHGPDKYWALQTQIWLHLAELYLTVDKLESAQACTLEGATIYPYSHMVSYMRGRILDRRGEIMEAKACYENACAINPSHVKSLQYLGLVHHKLGNNRMAEKVLRDAANIDPTAPLTWLNLGKVLEVLEDYEAASECLTTAVELELTTPIVPFSIIPKKLH